MEAKTELARCTRSSALHAWGLLLMAMCGWDVSAAQALGSSARTTLIVFVDAPFSEGQWSSLLDALRRERRSLPVEIEASKTDVEVVRGDAVAAGAPIDSPIVVFLRGNCVVPLQPPRRYPARARLGWVLRREGVIEPFVNVDCTRTGEMMQPSSYWLSPGDRTSAMSAAVARVIVHEWIHIATQSSAHRPNSISKAQFNVDDLTREGTGSVSRGGTHAGR